MKRIVVEYDESLDSLDHYGLYCHFDSYGHRHRIGCVNWPGQFPAKPQASFAILRSATALYVDFKVTGNYLRAVNFKNLSPVAQDSCVEFFLSPTADNHYFNFEFNCIGAVNASHRSRRDCPTRLTDDEIKSIRRYPSVGTEPFDERGGVHSWRLTVAIPISLLELDNRHFPASMTGNFYKCGGLTSEPHYLSWNPISSPKPDFHITADFGKLLFKGISINSTFKKMSK